MSRPGRSDPGNPIGGNAMNRSDLVDRVSASRGETRAKVAEVLDAVLSTITATLASGEKVTLPGFGTFQARSRQPRTGRNPRTGETVPIAATTVAVFKAGTSLKAEVSGLKAAPAASKANPKAAPKESAKAAPAASKASPKAASPVEASAKAASPKQSSKSSGRDSGVKASGKPDKGAKKAGKKG